MNELKPEDVMYWLAQYPEEAVCRDALDLLHKYQAENAEKDAEIERLTNGRDDFPLCSLSGCEGASKDCHKTCPDSVTNKARAEAITEFANIVCENRVSNDPVVIAVRCVEKEMKGEEL